MNSLDVRLDAHDAWLCQHTDLSGRVVEPTHLNLQQSQEWPTSMPRRWLRCPDCATFWTVWPRERTARPSIEWTPEMAANPSKFRRAPSLDIDRIIGLTRESLADVIVVQYHLPHVADDEGLWWFELQAIKNNIQLESPNGMCPFFAETSSMKSATDGKRMKTVDEAADFVIEYLQSQRRGNEDAATPPCHSPIW
ncbi:MAG: hypothetical protein JWL69_4685 [Phycisphaerales bacterium]|nr:hypothetical protein [Phycisphaerales bacterium]